MPAELWPSSPDYLGLLSWTSRTFYFQILGTFTRFSEGFLGRERSQGGSPSVREDPLGSPPLSLPRKSLRTSKRSRESGKEKILEVRDNERK